MSSHKVTSVGSSSGIPSPPNVTPLTGAIGVENGTPGPQLDAVGAALVPIQETLNEDAEIALLPSPPYNTPHSFSPAPSSFAGARNRGLSAVGDRLLQLILEHSSNIDGYASSSNHSITASITSGDNRDNGDNESGAEADSEVEAATEPEAEVGSQISHPSSSGLNPPTSDISTISPELYPIALDLGSPPTNPRIDEYLNFQSRDLPVVDPNMKGSSSTAAARGTTGTSSELSFKCEESIHGDKGDKGDKGEGVTEKSNWAEELEEASERIFLQMEQLASDEAATDPSRTMEECYTSRLARILANENRKVKLEVRQKW